MVAIAFEGSGSGYGDGYGYGWSGWSGYGYGDGGSGSGYGYGDGGSGSGYGSGDGYGYGWSGWPGYGYGDGWSGSGSGYGYGDGGSGSGYGYGDGDGWSGSGSGDGDGVASEAYYAALTDVPEADAARREGAVVALWRCTAGGLPANGGNGLSPAKAGDRHIVPGPLSLCHRNTLHATFRPDVWAGERLFVVACRGDIAVDGNKLGCLDRELLAEVKWYVKAKDKS